MGIQVDSDRLRWRVHLNAPPEAIFSLLTTDSGRERFWAEASQQSGAEVILVFPDRSSTTLRILESHPPHRFVVNYFGAETTFQIHSVERNCSILELTASRVPPGELIDVAAGWVSVLMSLKAVVNFGNDLRNHTASRTWNEAFVDN